MPADYHTLTHYEDIFGQVLDGLKWADLRRLACTERSASGLEREVAERLGGAAYWRLGKAIFDGADGVPPDDAACCRAWHRASVLGHSVAQRELGLMHFSGRGVAQDDTLAAAYLREAAEQGDAEAMHRLALMHRGRRGWVPWAAPRAGEAPEPRNAYASALLWFHRAVVEGGNAPSAYELGKLYSVPPTLNGAQGPTSIPERDDGAALCWCVPRCRPRGRGSGRRRRPLRQRL